MYIFNVIVYIFLKVLILSGKNQLKCMRSKRASLSPQLPLLLQSQSALLTSGQPPGCPLSSPALLIHSQRHRQARGHKRLSLPCFFPCHSTPTLFPLAIPNPDHSGTALSFHASMTLHMLFLKTGMLSIPSFSISKTPTVFARQLRCHLLCEVSSPTHQL